MSEPAYVGLQRTWQPASTEALSPSDGTASSCSFLCHPYLPKTAGSKTAEYRRVRKYLEAFEVTQILLCQEAQT